MSCDPPKVKNKNGRCAWPPCPEGSYRSKKAPHDCVVRKRAYKPRPGKAKKEKELPPCPPGKVRNARNRCTRPECPDGEIRSRKAPYDCVPRKRAPQKRGPRVKQSKTFKLPDELKFTEKQMWKAFVDLKKKITDIANSYQTSIKGKTELIRQDATKKWKQMVIEYLADETHYSNTMESLIKYDYPLTYELDRDEVEKIIRKKHPHAHWAPYPIKDMLKLHWHYLDKIKLRDGETQLMVPYNFIQQLRKDVAEFKDPKVQQKIVNLFY
jgi:hypothetical protein